MAIDPKLIVIKPVDELEEVTGLQPGSMLFYDGSDNLKRISVDAFNNLSKSAIPLSTTDPSPTVSGTYKPITSGTYANAGGLIAQAGYDTLFFYNGTTWTKSEFAYPQATQFIPLFTDSTFPLVSTTANPIQRIHEDAIWQLTPGETATSGDVPGVSSKWANIGSSISPQFDPTTTIEAQGGKQISDWLMGYSEPIPETRYLEHSLSDMTTDLTTGAAARTYVIRPNPALSDTLTNVTKVIVNFSVAGLITVAKFSYSGNVYTRLSTFTYTADSVGIKEITLPSEFRSFAPNEVIGFIINNTTALARLKSLPASTAIGYQWGNIDSSATTVTITTASTSRIGVELVNGTYDIIHPPALQTAEEFDENNSTDFQGAKQINNWLFGESLILADTNYLDATSTLSSGDRTYIVDTKHTEDIVALRIKIKSNANGSVGINKYQIDTVANTGTRIYANPDLYPLQIGDNVITLKEELQKLQPGEYLGIVQNTGSLLGRVMGIVGTPTGYGYWSISGNFVSGSTGTQITGNRLGVQIEAEVEGKIDSELGSILDELGSLKPELSFSTPPDYGMSQIYKSGFTRNTSTGMFRLNTGELIAECSSFEAGTSDNDPSTILFKISYDNGNTWRFYSRIRKQGSDIGIYNPSLYYVGNTLHVIGLVKTSVTPLQSKLVHTTSSDNGLTWDAYTDLTGSTSYKVNVTNRIHTHNGTMFYPYSLLISGDGNSQSSTYYGRFLKSTDNGATWTESGVEIVPTVGILRVEGGFFTNAAGNLVYYFRTRNSSIMAYNSTDNGLTFGAEYTLISNVPNSMSSIVKLQNSSKWVAVYNNRIGAGDGFTSRLNLVLATSNDGVTFTPLTDYVFEFNGRDYPFEPTIYEDRFTNGLIITFSQSNEANTAYDAAFIHVDYNSI